MSNVEANCDLRLSCLGHRVCSQQPDAKARSIRRVEFDTGMAGMWRESDCSHALILYLKLSEWCSSSSPRNYGGGARKLLPGQQSRIPICSDELQRHVAGIECIYSVAVASLLGLCMLLSNHAYK